MILAPPDRPNRSPPQNPTRGGGTCVRKVVLYQLLSLDGVAEEPSDWLFDDASELVANLSAVIGSQDDVLLGRGTFDYWVGFWPTSRWRLEAGIRRRHRHPREHSARSESSALSTDRRDQDCRRAGDRRPRSTVVRRRRNASAARAHRRSAKSQGQRVPHLPSVGRAGLNFGAAPETVAPWPQDRWRHP